MLLISMLPNQVRSLIVRCSAVKPSFGRLADNFALAKLIQIVGSLKVAPPGWRSMHGKLNQVKPGLYSAQ